MNILETILNASGGDAARQAGAAAGLSESQTSSALGALIPALAAGMSRNAAQPGGLESLFGALAGGGHAQYVDNPASFGRQETISEGNGILGHLLGSKDVSRAVASQASAQTGIGADVLKKLLPMAATLMMGALAKQKFAQAAPASGLQAAAARNNLFSMLTPMLDSNRDGSVVDDLLGKVGRFLGR
jgi:hypothetical protein